MERLNRYLSKIPGILASTPSVFIFIFLFVYLVLFGIVGIWVPAIEPSGNIQLIFGNYTNVLSALGASLAAGAGAVHAKRLRDLHAKHDDLKASIDDLHAKIDALAGKIDSE